MKKTFKILLMLAFGIFLLAGTVMAIPISGEISFSGKYTLDNPNLSIATTFTSFSNVVTQGGTGDYSAVPYGTPAIFNSFTFAPITVPIAPLWTFNYLGKTYSFEATTMSIVTQTANILAVQGGGLANITGFDASYGIWNVSANTFGTTFSFSSSAAVPEPTTLLLLGLGLVGIAGVSRKFKK